MDDTTAVNLAQTLIDEAPAPSDQADAIALTLDQARNGTAPAVPALPGPLDSSGAPGKVETRGRHKKGCACPSCAAKALGAKSSGKTTAATDPYTAPAIALVGMYTGLAQMIVDPVEWKPEQAELDLMVRAWHDQFQRSGTTDFPPIAAIIISLAGYILPRLSRPKTATRMQRFGAWIGGLFGRKVKRDEGKKE